MNKEWSELNKTLQRQLRKKDSYEDLLLIKDSYKFKFIGLYRTDLNRKWQDDPLLIGYTDRVRVKERFRP